MLLQEVRQRKERVREKYRDRQWAGCEASPTDGQSFKPTLSFYGRDRTHVVQGSTLNQDSNNDFTLWPVLKLPAGHSCYKAQYPFAKAWQPFGITTASLRKRKRERKGGRDRELSNRCQLSNRARKKKMTSIHWEHKVGERLINFLMVVRYSVDNFKSDLWQGALYAPFIRWYDDYYFHVIYPAKWIIYLYYFIERRARSSIFNVLNH